MKNRLAPRAILFEPDRRNRVHLGANLLINGLLDANLEIHPVALGAEPGRFRLVPGPERDIGLSQIVETAPEGQGYEVEVVRFDDFVKAARSQSRSTSSATSAKCSPAWPARCATIGGSCRSKCSKRARRLSS